MKDYIYGVKEKDTDAEENSVASVLHVTTNEMSSMLNEFSNQIMNGGN